MDEQYYMFRFTLDPEIDEKFYVKNFLNMFRDILGLKTFTIGLERFNRYGEPTAPHIHVTYTSDKNPESVRKSIRRKLDSVDDKRKGNGVYSLKCVTRDLHNEFRLFRYTLKQNGREFDEQMIFLPLDFDLEIQRQIAYEEWLKSVDTNKKARDKAENKQSTFDKLSDYLDAKECQSIKSIQTEVINFYKENKLSCNFKTMMGYVNTYRLLKGWMSMEEAIEKMNKFE